MIVCFQRYSRFYGDFVMVDKQENAVVCMVCGDLRPISAIKTLKKDVSEEHGAPKGTMFINVRYCADKKECHDAAPEVHV